MELFANIYQCELCVSCKAKEGYIIPFVLFECLSLEMGTPRSSETSLDVSQQTRCIVVGKT